MPEHVGFTEELFRARAFEAGVRKTGGLSRSFEAKPPHPTLADAKGTALAE
jgi:hypothetical protein